MPRARNVVRGLPGAHLVVGLFAAVLCFIPLFDVLGVEFAAAVGWCLAYVSGWRSAAAAARARAGSLGGFPGEHLLRVGLENLTLALTPLVVIALHALRVPTCNWSAGAIFYALFPLPAIAYGTTLGFALGTALPAGRARLLFVAWSFATYAVAIVRLIAEPPIFAFNAFVGYFPGPIYDSEIEVGRALLVARGVVLLEAALFAVLAALGWDGTRWRASRLVRGWRHERAVLGGLASCIAVALLLVAAYSAPLGIAIDREDIQRTLGGHVETEHCRIFFDRGAMSDARAARLAAEHEARYAQLASYFGLEPKRKIRSYVYASAAQKKRLMGAAGTSFEDAIHDEFHINASSEDPHPVLTHEMAHIFAAQIDPWRPICWKIGIHEGIAVAAEWNEECVRLEMTPHQACAAMDSLELLPDVERVLSAAGFWTAPGARAYTACGSFVHWLVERRGMERFRVLWRRGDFERAYGTGLPALVEEWKAMLAETPVDAALGRRAERLFRPPSIFGVECARELARLESQAASALGRRDAGAAESLYTRLLEIDPRDPERWLALGRARLGHGDVRGAAAAASEALDATDRSTARERAWRLRGDTAWLAGRGAEAAGLAPPESCYAVAARLASSSADARAVEVSLGVLGEARLRDLLGPYLVDGGLPDAAGLARLAIARAEAPEAGIVRYLLGRRLFFAAEFELAATELDAALGAGDLGPEAQVAALELRARAALGSGEPALALARFEELASRPFPEWRRRGAADWAARCRHELGSAAGPQDP